MSFVTLRWVDGRAFAEEFNIFSSLIINIIVTKNHHYSVTHAQHPSLCVDLEIYYMGNSVEAIECDSKSFLIRIIASFLLHKWNWVLADLI